MVLLTSKQCSGIWGILGFLGRELAPHNNTFNNSGFSGNFFKHVGLMPCTDEDQPSRSSSDLHRHIMHMWERIHWGGGNHACTQTPTHWEIHIKGGNSDTERQMFSFICTFEPLTVKSVYPVEVNVSEGQKEAHETDRNI